MYNIALLGFGTVCQGVYDQINEWNKTSNKQITIKKILIRNYEKYKNTYPNINIFDDNWSNFTNENFDFVISALGGINPEYKYIKFFLKNKIPVITANKAVVAAYFDILTSLSSKNNTPFLYEASVGGGTYIVKAIKDISSYSKINNIEGILNGTSNYILSCIDKGYNFDNSLLEAQNLGFAEADPSSDLEGFDLLNKITILSNLAFNTCLKPSQISILPLPHLSNVDLKWLKSNNYSLKYIASADRKENSLYIDVFPLVISNNHLYNSIDYSKNIISIKSDSFNHLSFIGEGAGKNPTASAIISDMFNLLNYSNFKNITMDNSFNLIFEKAKYYIRLPINSKWSKNLLSYNCNENECYGIIEIDNLELRNELLKDSYALLKLEE